MKTYAITIKLQSAFGTPFKGDTIFGHFCWQAVFDNSLLNKGFEHWLDCYQETPFAVFSSAWPKLKSADGSVFYCLPKPAMPQVHAREMTRLDRVGQRKKAKRQKWVMVEHNRLHDDLFSCPFINDSELFEYHMSGRSAEEKQCLQFLPPSSRKPVIRSSHVHNSINRLTMTTGKGSDPFSMEDFNIVNGLELVIFVSVEESALSKEQLQTGMDRIGQTGFGRDASTGLGRFLVSEINELSWPSPVEGQGFYTLGPCVPEDGEFIEQFAIPFTRFGRHGGHLVMSGNPFKNPVIMADEGAVFIPPEGKLPSRPFIGKAVTQLSLVEKRTVGQGYTLYLPINRRL